MNTLPPCDHDECPPTHCAAPAPANGSAWTALEKPNAKGFWLLIRTLKDGHETPSLIWVEAWAMGWAGREPGDSFMLIEHFKTGRWYGPLHETCLAPEQTDELTHRREQPTI